MEGRLELAGLRDHTPTISRARFQKLCPVDHAKLRVLEQLVYSAEHSRGELKAVELRAFFAEVVGAEAAESKSSMAINV